MNATHDDDAALSARASTRFDTFATNTLVVATAVLYFAGAKLGLSMAFVAEQVTPVWPPTGIALAALLVFGHRVWPGIFAGAFLANATAAEPLATAAGIALGNTLEAVVAAGLLRAVGFRPSLERLRDVLALAVFAAALSPVIAATIGVVSLAAGGVQPWSAFRSLWWVWWVGDAMGALVIAPALLVWSAPSPLGRDHRRPVEAAVLLVSAILMSVAVFANGPGARAPGYPLYYMMFPLVVWAALRFGQRATTAVVLIASAIAIWSTVHERGPFAVGVVGESLILLQLFMAVVAVTTMLLAAGITERDVVEGRRREDYRRLEVTEQRLRLALESGAMTAWEWNIATGAMWSSGTMDPLHGFPPGKGPETFEAWIALVHPDDRPVVNAAISRALAERGVYVAEFRNLWPDGTTSWIAGRARAFFDPTGRATHMTGIVRDVTKRRQLEEELRVRADQLADADRRKDEFLAMLAHELRNPLAALSTSLHLLATDAPGRERSMQVAGRQLAQLVRLVDDLLDVSRITRGLITLRREPVAIADVVRSAVEVVRPALDARRQALTVSLPAEPIVLDVDIARMIQVIGNLLGNAAKYTPPGGAIRLTAERVEEEVVLRVRDSGIGLAPDLVPHVFDLFVQGTSTIDRTRGGLGIGLTVVRRLVEMHDGRVEARSPGVGHGSEFIVVLPVSRASVAPPPPRPVAAETPAARPLKVLVVEDNQDAAESLKMVLELWGHDVRVALDGLAALEIAEEFEPDVILSDLGLPGIDGFELAGRLRQHRDFGGAVLVALSGYGRDDDKRRALDAGFDHHLVKPPDLDALTELLGRIGAAAGAVVTETVH